MEKMKKLVHLDENSEAIQYLCNKDKRFKKVYSMIGPISYETHEDIYAFLIREIIEQMLSIKAANVIFSRLEFLCNGIVTPEAIRALSDEQIKGIGTSERKIKTIRELTRMIQSNELDLNGLHQLDDKAVIETLTKIKGIGNWTAKMVLIFSLDRQDILPTEDIAFIQGFKWAYKPKEVSEKEICKICKKWKPYSSIAARYMYRALDMGLTKEQFHLYK